MILASTKMLGAPSWRQLARQSCGLTRADLAQLTGEHPRHIRRVECDPTLAEEPALDPIYSKLDEIAAKLIHLPARARGGKSQSKYAKAKAIDRPQLSRLEAAEHLLVREELGLDVPAATEERAKPNRPRGRPKTEGPRSEGQPELRARVDRAIYQQIEKLAEAEGRKLADWVREACMEKIAQ